MGTQYLHIDGLVQHCSISSALAAQIMPPYIKSSIYKFFIITAY